MEKVKVSKEIGLALERTLIKGEDSLLGKEGYLIYNYLNNSFSAENKCIKELSLKQLTDAAFLGYEIKKTPEEKIEELYKSHKNLEINNYSEGVKFGILSVLENMDIKIKGVNY